MTRLRNNDGSPLHPMGSGACRPDPAGADRPALLPAHGGLCWASRSPAPRLWLDGGLIVRPALAQEPKTGGILRMAMKTQEITDPANYNWIEASNITRNVIEYLTEVDAENVVHPYLAESWTPSDDLKVWSFKLRQGVKWSNGDDFTTDDVEANFKRWLRPESKSVNRTQFAGTTFEKVGPHEFKLQPGEAQALDPRGALRLHLLHRAPQLRRHRCELPEEPARHRPLQPGRVRHRQARPGDPPRRATGARRPISTRSSISTSAATSPPIWGRWRRARSTPSTASPWPSSTSPSACPTCS